MTEIGLDTNVLVRYLAQDDAVQSAQATRIIERQLTEERPGFISLVTMVETVWVLDRVYRLSNHEIAAAGERILQSDTLLVQNEQQVFTAIVALKSGARSFPDALIGALGAWVSAKWPTSVLRACSRALLASLWRVTWTRSA